MYIPRRQSQGSSSDVDSSVAVISVQVPSSPVSETYILSYYLLDKMLHGCPIWKKILSLIKYHCCVAYWNVISQHHCLYGIFAVL